MERLFGTSIPSLAVLDVDGTLVSLEGELTPLAQDACRRLREAGVDIVVATGRSWYAIEPFWGQFSSALPAICVNGRVVYDPTYGEVLQCQSIAAAAVQAIRREVEPFATVSLETVHTVWVPNAVAALMMRSTFLVPRSVVRIGQPEASEPSIRLYIASRRRDRPLDDGVIESVRQILPNGDGITRAGSHWLIVHAGASCKSEGLACICERRRLSPERAIAFGDGTNDIGLFRAVGWAVAVNNAPDEVKQCARFITDRPGAEGVAEFVSAWLASAGGTHDFPPSNPL